MRAIARLISRAESGDAAARPVLAALYGETGRAHIVGVTGVPGSGKSSLVQQLVHALRSDGRTVGVLAVDPSSPFSGGSVLGDRIRMTEHAGDPGVFIRSMATRGALGGLARAAMDAVDVMDAGGFDTIIIETVGAGQDEVDIVRAAHTTVVVSAPGLGDDIQAIKAGILEIADIHVVSKCDRSDANKTIVDLKAMLALSLVLDSRDPWATPVVPTSAETGEGIADLRETIARHHGYLIESGTIADRRHAIAEARTLKIAEDLVRRRLLGSTDDRARDLVAQVAARTIDPHHAAALLLERLSEVCP